MPVRAALSYVRRRLFFHFTVRSSVVVCSYTVLPYIYISTYILFFSFSVHFVYHCQNPRSLLIQYCFVQLKQQFGSRNDFRRTLMHTRCTIDTRCCSLIYTTTIKLIFQPYSDSITRNHAQICHSIPVQVFHCRRTQPGRACAVPPDHSAENMEHRWVGDCH